MRNSAAATRMGLIASALVFLFTLTSVTPAQAKPFNLKNQLQKNGVSMKIVKLDRTDGFRFGLSFTGPQGNTFVLAPGRSGMFLVQADGSETILQRDAAGNIQIIQADVNLQYALCLAQAVITFLYELTDSDTDPGYVLVSIIDLVTNVLACRDLAASTI